MNVPLNVWLSAIVLFIFSGYTAWQNPMLWLQCLTIVIVVVSFCRVAYFLIEKE
jgi:hypothetical protein